MLDVTRRERFGLGAEHGLIDEVEQRMRFHRARNLTSRTYNEDVALETDGVAREFPPPRDAPAGAAASA